MNKKNILLIISIFLSVFLLVPREKKLVADQKLLYVNELLNEVTIFLKDKNNYIGRTKILLNSSSLEDQINDIIDVLIIGGEKEELVPSGFKSIIASDTILNKLEIQKNTVKLDFNEHLLDLQEEKVLESLVYSITNLDNIDNIIIFINGELLTKYKNSNLQLNMPLDKSIGINKTYDLLNVSNVVAVTTYYAYSNNNCESYYIPITKYTNDRRDKFNIIIEELKGSNLINDVPYINNKLSIISIENNDETLKINFNKYIFNDENSISDDVLNTFLYSIKDNYSVKNVIFYVESQEICKKVL